MALSLNEQLDAMAILSDCVEDGRIESGADGDLNRESVRVEVSFEASEQGYDDETAEAMGEYAAENC